MSEEIKNGELKSKYDVIIIPSDSPSGITGIFPENSRIDPEGGARTKPCRSENP